MDEAIAECAFAPADLSSFCRLGGLGLVVTGQRVEPSGAVLALVKALARMAPGWRTATAATRR